MSEKKNIRREKGNKIYEMQVFEKEFPNGLKKHNPDYPGQKGQINSLGFRSHEFNSQKEVGLYRIVILGGSTTAGYESDIDHTFSAVIERKFNKNSDSEKKFAVIYARKGEEDMGYVNSVLAKEIVYYEPDMAVLYLTFNHLHMRRACLNVPNDLYHKVFMIKQWLSDKSLFFLTFREKATILFQLEGKVCGDIYIPVNTPKKLAKSFLNTPRVFNEYKKYLENFVNICKRKNITPALVTEACVIKGDSYLLLGKGMDIVYDKMYRIMEQVAKEKGAIFIDAAREMKAIPGNEKLFNDGLHLYPEGNEVLAELFMTVLKLR
ncbi:MAG: hypothetical protein HQ579_03940 [Candidatus Omnitrophica bacterium]|nr:hypothetical protein [Candidatus Omnitrophota bacterium]